MTEKKTTQQPTAQDEGLSAQQKRMGLRLRVVREAIGLLRGEKVTLEDLARILGLESKSGPHRYETGVSAITAAMLWKLEREFSVPCEYIVHGRKTRLPADMRKAIIERERVNKIPQE